MKPTSPYKVRRIHRKYVIVRALKETEFAVIFRISSLLFSHFQTTPRSHQRRETVPFKTWREIFHQPIFSENEFSCLCPTVRDAA